MNDTPFYNVVASTSENTVVAKYEPAARSNAYQSEAELEKEFIRMLEGQGYEYLRIRTEADLIPNLRKCLEELNAYRFSDNEWKHFFTENIGKNDESIEEKTRRIQEDYVQVLTKDDGEYKNIRLIDKENIHNNKLQVINQYEVGEKDGARRNNRYDVTLLVNGLPLVHIELKRRGVAIKEAFNQIERYQRDSFWAGTGLFNYVQVFVISNGTNTKYYSNTTRWNAVRENVNRTGRQGKTSHSFEFTSFWADAENKILPDLVDFTRTFFARHTLLNILTRYCVFTAEKMLLVMRPYQITATERVLNRITIANNYKNWGKVEGGGYIWHTTGSGKTLTSFKCAQLVSKLPFIDKVLFVVDRKDLDYQTMREYDRFQKGCADSNTSSAVLQRQLGKTDSRIIITTIQKLSAFIKKNKVHEAYDKRIVFIFDECHRSQFGEMHHAITHKFKKYHLFGFTGTPIFAQNATKSLKNKFFTTADTFGDKLHTYTIVDAINDRNVLPFRVDYIKTMDKEDEVEDEDVWDINREAAYLAPQRISKVTEYILEHFDQKTYRGQSSHKYSMCTLASVSSVASAKRKQVTEQKEKREVRGFNSILAVSSVEAACLYYREFQKQMAENPDKRLRIATIFSFAPNEDEEMGLLDEENSEDTAGLDTTSRDFLEKAIKDDYNKEFKVEYDTSSEKFQNYYKDVSLRMKNKELDLLIVVNMFLTGFDATTLNTLWVDKRLKMHGLLQAFSRTNRILNSVKVYGNIVCFRPLKKRVDEAISLFGDKEAGGVVLLRPFEDYYYGYTDEKGKEVKGFVHIVQELQGKYPLSEPRITGEKNQKEFIRLFGSFLRMRNLLSSFDEFDDERKILSDGELQDYLSRYQDLRDEWRAREEKGEKTDISEDLVFETELICQVDINIDYILMLVQKYHADNCKDEELRVKIRKAISASPELRSKKDLIEAFIDGLREVDDIMSEWRSFISKKQESDLLEIIESENLKPIETRFFMANAFRLGEVKTTGVAINELMPPISRFADRAAIKQNILNKLTAYFERYRGISSFTNVESEYNIAEESVLEDVEES